MTIVLSFEGGGELEREGRGEREGVRSRLSCRLLVGSRIGRNC